MPRDLSSFRQKLEAPPRWLESVDPRLVAIGDLVDKGDAARAADMAEELFAEGLTDVRALVAVLYAAFLEGTLDTMPAILEVVQLSVGENLEMIGPAERKKTLFDRRFAWLFERIADQLKYHEQNKTERMEAWAQADEAELTTACALAETLGATLRDGNYDTAARQLGRVTTWLRSRAESVAAMNAPTPEEPSMSSPAPSPAPSHLPEEREGRVTLAVSHEFAELCRKLKAFETLVEKGRHDKAALVAADLQQLIAQFDPRAYFPELFSTFAALFSEHIETLSHHFEQRESPAWGALDQFYRVDLKAFVET